MTLSEYQASTHPGQKVTITFADGIVLKGIAGNLWPGPIPVVKLKDGSIVQVTENIVDLIAVEKMN